MVQVRRRQTSGGRVNPGYGDPDRGTSVVQLRPIALRRGQFADRYPVTPVLACKQVWRKWRARLIWTIEKRRWDCAGCRAQSARVWEGDGATARAFCRSRVSGHTDACTQVDAGGRWGRFWTIEKRRWDCAGCRAQSARVWEGDGATARAVCRPWVLPVTPMLAHMLARAVDGTDFRPSRNGDGGCARWRAQPARVSGSDGATAQAVCRRWVSGSHRWLHTCWRGRSMGQIFDHR